MGIDRLKIDKLKIDIRDKNKQLYNLTGLSQTSPQLQGKTISQLTIKLDTLSSDIVKTNTDINTKNGQLLALNQKIYLLDNNYYNYPMRYNNIRELDNQITTSNSLLDKYILKRDKLKIDIRDKNKQLYNLKGLSQTSPQLQGKTISQLTIIQNALLSNIKTTNTDIKKKNKTTIYFNSTN